MHPIDKLILDLSDVDWRVHEEAFCELLTMEDMGVDKRLRAKLQDEFFGGGQLVKKLLSLRDAD